MSGLGARPRLAAAISWVSIRHHEIDARFHLLDHLVGTNGLPIEVEDNGQRVL